ncbi:MAG: DUF4124 domain-containing protein [Burkholderiaceae bacterium]
MLTAAPLSALAGLYKWIGEDGTVTYGDTPPRHAKNVRLVSMDAINFSEVPGISKEERDRLRERENQLRLQRLELEVEALRASEQARASTAPEVVYSDVYVPVLGHRVPPHRRPVDSAKGRLQSEQLVARPRPPNRTLPVEDSQRTLSGVMLRH